MSEIRTNLIISGESLEYRSNIQISVVTLDNNLVDTQSSFRTNLNIVSSLNGEITSNLNTILKLENTALDFYLVDMTKLNQSVLYFSKFFNMHFEPEVMWELLAQGTKEQINISHLTDALSLYIKEEDLIDINTSINNLKQSLDKHILNNNIHLTQGEKSFLYEIMNNPPWGNTDNNRSGLFEYINVGTNTNVIWAARPIKYENKDVGIISNTFISCKGVDVTAGSGGGGITRADLFSILSGDPIDTNEYINAKYLKLDENLKDYAKKDWVELTFIKEEKDPTVPMYVKNIQQEQINAWDLVSSLFSVSKDDTYILVNDNRGLVSNSFLSCKGLDVSAANSGSGIDMSLVWYYLGLDGNEQINKSHITTALNGYATEDWVSSNYVLGSTYTNQIQTINTNISKKADKTLTITAGNGLTGGGTLEENRTITLGNPSTITDETDNTVSEESHTHKINKASTTVVGIVKLYDALDSNSNILALTANQGKILGDRVILLEDMWENKNTYLLAKKDRGIVSNSFISVKGLDTSAPQTGSNFDRSSLFSILSSSPQSGEFINIEYLDLSDYATKSDLTSKISLDEADKRYVLLTSFTTLNNKVNNFLEGSDTDNIINKWKELEAFLEGQTETSTLADLLSYKLDTSVYDTFIGTLGTAAYKEASDFLVSTTKYAIADAVGGNALNALNANRLGEQEPTYYAKASDLQLLLNVIGIDENGDVYIKKNGETARNFYTYGAISFGGIGSGSSGGGITEITYDMVVGALGYTPYNSTNPNGYVTSGAIPSYLPNPYALTINGQTYDGSAPVTISITGGGSNLDKVQNYGLFNQSSFKTTIGYPIVNEGIIEIGNRIDMHSIEGSNDYEVSIRIKDGETTKRKIYLPAEEGTLALVSQITGGGTTITWNDITSKPSLVYYDTHIDTNTLANSVAKMGYGYATEGWYESGPALSFGVENYQFQMQMRLSGDISSVVWRPVQSGTKFTWRHFLDAYNYSSYALPLSGGTINGHNAFLLTINTDTVSNLLTFQKSEQAQGYVGYYAGRGFEIRNAGGSYIGVKDNGEPYYNSNILIHSGNIGSYNAGSASKLGTYAWSLTNANDITFTDYALRYYASFPSSASNIPTSNGYQNAILAMPLHGNGRTAQFYFVAEGKPYYRSIHTDSWNEIAYVTDNVASAQKLSHSNGAVGATVASGGNVLIGTTTDNGDKLQVHGTVRVALPSASADAMFYGQRTDLGYSIGLGIGTSSNRGIYDNTLGWCFKIDTSNNLSIVGHTVAGNLIATGSITFGSDVRYKNILKDVSIDLETIANAPLFNYKWTDSQDDRTHLGTTAQYWNNTAFKNAVIPTNDATKWTMSYSEIAMGNTIVIARELIPIKSDVQMLKERVEKLESILRSNNIKFD